MTAVVSASALRANCGYPRALKHLVSACEQAVRALAVGIQVPTADERRLVSARRTWNGVTREWIRSGRLLPLSGGEIADLVCLLDCQKAARDDGHQLHQAVETWARTRELPVLPDLEMQGWLDLLAADWSPPLDGEYEVAWGLAPILSPAAPPTYVEVTEPEPHVYVARDGGPLLTAGRADGAWTGGDCSLVVCDWKTGKWPTTPAVDNLQVNAAGIALALKRGMTSYIPAIYYARDGYWDMAPRVVFGTAAFERIWGEIRSAALLDEKPRPGPHCADCWERRTKRCSHAPPGI